MVGSWSGHISLLKIHLIDLNVCLTHHSLSSITFFNSQICYPPSFSSFLSLQFPPCHPQLPQPSPNCPHPHPHPSVPTLKHIHDVCAPSTSIAHRPSESSPLISIVHFMHAPGVSIFCFPFPLISSGSAHTCVHAHIHIHIHIGT